MRCALDGTDFRFCDSVTVLCRNRRSASILPPNARDNSCVSAIQWSCWLVVIVPARRAEISCRFGIQCLAFVLLQRSNSVCYQTMSVCDVCVTALISSYFELYVVCFVCNMYDRRYNLLLAPPSSRAMGRRLLLTIDFGSLIWYCGDPGMVVMIVIDECGDRLLFLWHPRPSYAGGWTVGTHVVGTDLLHASIHSRLR